MKRDVLLLLIVIVLTSTFASEAGIGSVVLCLESAKLSPPPATKLGCEINSGSPITRAVPGEYLRPPCPPSNKPPRLPDLDCLLCAPDEKSWLPPTPPPSLKSLLVSLQQLVRVAITLIVGWAKIRQWLNHSILYRRLLSRSVSENSVIRFDWIQVDYRPNQLIMASEVVNSFPPKMADGVSCWDDGQWIRRKRRFTEEWDVRRCNDDITLQWGKCTKHLKKRDPALDD